MSSYQGLTFDLIWDNLLEGFKIAFIDMGIWKYLLLALVVGVVYNIFTRKIEAATAKKKKKAKEKRTVRK